MTLTKKNRTVAIIVAAIVGVFVFYRSNVAYMRQLYNDLGYDVNDSVGINDWARKLTYFKYSRRSIIQQVTYTWPPERVAAWVASHPRYA